jgi:hypothetical protein
MAGEFLVVGQLFKRKLQASVTLGNAKAIDVLVYNPRTERSFSVSVKTLRARNCFPMKPSAVSPSHTYIFVVLNEPGTAEHYFVVPGTALANDLPAFFGASLEDEDRPAVNFGPLKLYENNWSLFEEAVADAAQPVVAADAPRAARR